MNLTRAAIEKNRITIVALLLIVAAGIGAYYNLPRAEDPGFTIRTAVVVTYFPGASPERVEMLVTDKLEKAIQEMPELDFVSSESKTGQSVVYVNIQESYTEMRPIWDDLRRKVDRASAELPSDVIGPIVNDEFGDVYGIVVSITGDGFSYAELKDIADDCRNELLLSREIAKVDIYGEQEERIFIDYNNSRLSELNISPGQLKTILDQRNIIIPGGEVFTDDERIVLEPTGNFDSVEDLRRTVIRIPGREQLLYLQDIAHVYRGYIDPPTSMARYMGQPCLALAINLREGGNILTMGEVVDQHLTRFRQSYPIGVEFDKVTNQAMFVESKINGFMASLGQAVGIVLLVMLLFLGIRTGLVVASLIPMAMIMAIFVMSLLDIGLNKISIASLIIALGMLVDNAIVMTESVMVSISEGQPPVKAAVDSANELRVPLLTSSLTTAAAFLPIYLAESTTGEYTAPLFEVVTITLLSSWVLALTMTPMLSVRFLKVKKSPESGSYNTRFYRKYRAFLLTLVRHPLLVLLGTIAIFALAIFSFRFIPSIFFPPNDKPMMFAELRLPVGTPIEKTEAMVDELEYFLIDSLTVDTAAGREEGIIDFISFIGSGAPRYVLAYGPEPQSPEYAYFIFNATSARYIDNYLTARVEAYCTKHFPDVTPNVRLLFIGPPVDHPIEIRISGKETEELFRIVERVRRKLEDFPGTKNVADNWGRRVKKLVVHVDQPRAQRAGLTSQDVAISLQTILSGIVTTDYREEENIIPVTLRSAAADRQDIGKLESHNIYVQATGRSVPLKQVADVEMVFEPSKILRRDRLKTVNLHAQITEGQNAIAMTQAFDRWLSEEAKDWSVGYKYEYGGELESSGEANESIVAKLPIALLFIVLLLVVQFNSIRKPIIIMLTVPLGLIGVVIGLLVADSYMGFMTMLGIISLAGIVINNAIVLLDRIRLEQVQNGLEPPRAVIEACQRRLRPILLTVGTTVGGLLPLWFGGDIMFEPMAIAIIFGLIFATLLTLGVVPVLYTLLYRVDFTDFKL
ncbi:MMPL family transporter [candidate division GN15 bacterium]|nr:MMPL family transporter [candidate division GN15 bacterium]